MQLSKPDYYVRCGRGKRPKFAAYDFETDGLGGPVVAITYIMEGQEEATYINGGTELEMLQLLTDVMAENCEFTWFAHNAQYEFRYFIDYLLDNRDKIHFFLRTDSDVFMIIIDIPDYGENKRIILRDSFAIWDLSLKQISQTFCPEFPKLDIDLENVRFDPSNPVHIEYAKRDSKTLLLSLIRFNEILMDTFDVNMHLTRAGTALAAWQRTLPSGEKFYNDVQNEDFIRSAYYGGLVFLTHTGRHEKARTYDINSSYPYQMLSMPLPLGNSVRTRLYSANHLGIFRVTVMAPDNLVVPILPKRDRKGIVWPRGTFETIVTSIEMDFAARHGYKFLQIHEGRVWHRTCQPFVDFISKCVFIRMNNESGSTLDWTAKYMQNSLYGKFAAKRERRKIYASLSDEELEGADIWGDFFIKKEFAEDMQCLPQWSVFITAYARIHLLRTIYAIGPENVLYGDTDSITVRNGVEIAVGKDYGKWKLEKEWQSFRAHGPKVYAGEMANGELKGAVKGIPKRKWVKDRVFEAILYGDADRLIRYRTLEKFVQVLKTRYNGERDAKRSISSLGRSRSWQELPDGRVRPRYWHDIEASEAKGYSRQRGSIAKVG